MNDSSVNTPPVPLAVSMGEPAGIGPDIILMALAKLDERSSSARPQILVFGDRHIFAERARMLGLDIEIPIEPTTPCYDLSPGVLSKQSAAATLGALDAALSAVASGQCSGLVTAPINKANLYEAGFRFPGHTEYLEHFARTKLGQSNAQSVMMLAGPRLRAVPVTIHIPLAEVPSALSVDAIVSVGTITAADLKRRFGLNHPRLAISGLNPHAGENGALGAEDEAVIAPAIKALREAGIDAQGPFPADTMFHEDARSTYDAAVCMYHDQALIPAKALDFHETVNVTLGLPFVRTSPDHGTALELAGTGKASPDSFLAALDLAWTMVQS